jgi:multiple antibiotic resistance protein
VIDPIAAAPVFVTLTTSRSAGESRRIALRACVAALAVLLVFAVGGGFLFRLFGITIDAFRIDAFRIAGGIVFVLLALPMLRGASHDRDARDRDPAADPAVVPLGVPLIAGPGAITTVMVLMGQSTSRLHTASLFAAIALALAATAIILVVSPAILRRLGAGGLALVTRVLGLIVCVIGVQLVLDGIRPVAIEILRAARIG